MQALIKPGCCRHNHGKTFFCKSLLYLYCSKCAACIPALFEKKYYQEGKSKRKEPANVRWLISAVLVVIAFSGCLRNMNGLNADSVLAKTDDDKRSVSWNEGNIPDGLFYTPGTTALTAHKMDALSANASFFPPQTILKYTLPVDGKLSLAVFSPDGKYILTIADSSAQVWDPVRGVPVGDQIRQSTFITHARISPDGTKILLTGTINACIYDPATGKLVKTLANKEASEPGFNDIAMDVKFSQDGKKILMINLSGTVSIWDAIKLKSIQTITCSYGLFKDAEFSPDGNSIVSIIQDNKNDEKISAQLWAAPHWTTVGKPIQFRHNYTVTAAAFSPDGTRALIASDDSTARTIDTKTGLLTGQIMKHEAEIRRAIFNSDGTTILACMDSTARLWNVKTSMATGQVLKHHGFIESIAFSPDGSTVLTTSTDSTARLWDAHTGLPIGNIMKHNNAVLCGQFNRKGTKIFTCAGNFAQIWDARNGRPVGKALKHEAAVYTGNFSPNGKWLVTGSQYLKNFCIWELVD